MWVPRSTDEAEFIGLKFGDCGFWGGESEMAIEGGGRFES